MARATTRSQRQPSQSQRQGPRGSQASQSQRRGQRGRADDEDEDDEDDEGDENENEELDSDLHAVANGDGDMIKKANDLVRLALFNEHKRTPLRRDEISKKVLGSSSRSFNTVYALAQDTLRKAFGMELVELQSRPEPEPELTEKEKEKEKEKAKKAKADGTGIKKRAAPSGTKTYILRSVLDPQLIEIAAAPNPDILAIEQADREAQDILADDDDSVPTMSTGSIFAWNNCDQLSSVGILYVILALILVEGRVINDHDLRSNLKKLNLGPGVQIPLTAKSTHTLTVDAFLTQLQRQGYLDRNKIGENKTGGGGKRGRGAAVAQDDGENLWEWKWGSRAYSEVGEVGIANFVAEFMVDKPGAEDGDEEEGGGNRKKKVENMYQSVSKAAGAPLMDLR